MGIPFAEKQQTKFKEPEALKLRKLNLLSDIESVEIKLLEGEHSKEVHKIMQRNLWEATHGEIASIISEKSSCGAFVERMLVGAGLGWPARYNEKNNGVSGDGAHNALFLEDISLLLAYEGKGIRNLITQERENYARSRGFAYTVGKADVSPAMERTYRELGYSFVQGENPLAVKRL
jgi:hypothetical protein